MGLPLYLAMTAAEIAASQTLPSNIAYMACHFSPYGTGLSNLPVSLPAESLLTLNDRTPIFGHDPHRITEQLWEAVQRFGCRGVVLDFQRPDCSEVKQLCQVLIQQLPCPVAVSELYAGELPCAVFLSAPQPDCSLRQHIKPWNGREIWLEAATDAQCFTVTERGCSVTSLTHIPAESSFRDDTLHCQYRIEAEETAVHFHLWRTTDDLNALLAEAETLGITQAVGLYQQLIASAARN